MFLGEGSDEMGSDGALEVLSEAAGECDPVAFTEKLSGLLGELALDSLEGQHLMDATLALEGLQRCLDAHKTAVIERLDTNDTTYREVGLATKTWKANRCHVPPGSVARELMVARTLTRFEGFAGALAAGRISVEHVVALANASNPRVIDMLIEIQDSLIDFASRNRFTHYVAHIRSIVALLDEDGPEPDHRDHNTARMAADGTANLHLVMDLTGADAVTAQRIINSETDRQHRDAVRENELAGIPIPEAPLLRARAITELLSRGAKANPASPRPAVEAVITLNTDSEGRPTHVHSVDGEGDRPHHRCGPVVRRPPATRRVRLQRQPAEPRPDHRLFSSGQRRALAARDGGCIFPGCDQPPARCAAHHLHQWILGGRTDCDNGALLCRRHHGLVHGSNPWTIEIIDLDKLDAELRAEHHDRAANAGLEPTDRVRIWHGPNGQTLLAQTSTDHHGPAQHHPTPTQHRRQTAA
ncbi:MAG: HNH endonuclease signature motif containing protein [Microthrixaceae bacterium]